jgi:hypothetical protein
MGNTAFPLSTLSTMERPQSALYPTACSASVYTMNTLEYRDNDTNSDRSYLVAAETPSYGATFPRSPCFPPSAKVIFNATLKMALIFVISTILLGGVLWLALPTVDA